jgi:hypothetical protein
LLRSLVRGSPTGRSPLGCSSTIEGLEKGIKSCGESNATTVKAACLKEAKPVGSGGEGFEVEAEAQTTENLYKLERNTSGETVRTCTDKAGTASFTGGGCKEGKW